MESLFSLGYSSWLIFLFCFYWSSSLAWIRKIHMRVINVLVFSRLHRSYLRHFYVCADGIFVIWRFRYLALQKSTHIQLCFFYLAVSSNLIQLIMICQKWISGWLIFLIALNLCAASEEFLELIKSALLAALEGWWPLPLDIGYIQFCVLVFILST